MANQVWSLRVDHIGFTDARTASDEVGSRGGDGRAFAGQFVSHTCGAHTMQAINAAHEVGALLATGGTKVMYELRRSTEAVQAAQGIATWWFVPAGHLRPIPYGNSFTGPEFKRMFRKPGGRYERAVSGWQAALGTGDAPTEIRVRYHYNPHFQHAGNTNLTTALLSSTTFDMPVMMEFELPGI